MRNVIRLMFESAYSYCNTVTKTQNQNIQSDFRN